MSFYQKQILLDNFGADGQAVLARARVLVVGAGGLGCAVLQQLAAMGVGHLIVVDGDQVSASNLSRQILYREDDVGSPKVSAAQRALRRLRPSCGVEVVAEYLSAELCEPLFNRVDVVVDATDNFGSKFLINAAALKFGRPLVWANAQKWEGQLAVFDSKGGPCYRCFLPEEPAIGGGECNETGVLGAVPNVLGCLQAIEVVKVLCHRAGVLRAPEPHWGELLSYSFRDSSFFKTKVVARPNCKVCAVAPDEIILPAPPVESCQGLNLITLAALKSAALGGQRYVLVDVREADEITAEPVEGAVAWPLSSLEANLYGTALKFEESVTYAFFCKSGKRSARAVQLLTPVLPRSIRLVSLLNA